MTITNMTMDEQNKPNFIELPNRQTIQFTKLNPMTCLFWKIPILIQIMLWQTCQL